MERIAPVMQTHVDEGRLSGAAMVIVRDGKIVYRDTVGFADVESQSPLTEDSVFRIYLMTKAITTTVYRPFPSTLRQYWVGRKPNSSFNFVRSLDSGAGNRQSSVHSHRA